MKRQNDQYIDAFRGKIPTSDTTRNLDLVKDQNLQADALVQNGKQLYEMGKLDEAEAQLHQAAKSNPDDAAAYYYLQLIQQERIHRVTYANAAETQTRVADVEKEWVATKSPQQPQVAGTGSAAPAAPVAAPAPVFAAQDGVGSPADGPVPSQCSSGPATVSGEKGNGRPTNPDAGNPKRLRIRLRRGRSIYQRTAKP